MVAFQRILTLICPSTAWDSWASANQAQRSERETPRASISTPKRVSNAVFQMREHWILKNAGRFKRILQHSGSTSTSRSKKGCLWRTQRFRRSSNWWSSKPWRESFTWKRTDGSWKSTESGRLKTQLRFLKFRSKLQQSSMRNIKNEAKISTNDPRAFTPSKITSVKQSKCLCLAITQVKTTTEVTLLAPLAAIF